MANTLYKATVRELEAVLPPRVVSQSLQEGLAAVGKNADTLAYGDAETILNRVLPRLTGALGAERAEAAQRKILERLAEMPDESELPVLDLGAQGRALRELREAARAFNIYFDWSETQKLRAQLAQLETEHSAERNAGALVAAGRAQLGALQQKLDHELSAQARELTVLEAALESSAALKSPEVRRLGLLLELIRSTQEARKLAPAEVERAHKLAGDLNAERSRLVTEVRALEEEFGTLLALEPTFAERLRALEQDAGTLSEKLLTAFRSELEAARETLRSTLQGEFQGGVTQHPESAQLLERSFTTLETTLPSAADVQRLRDLLRSEADAKADTPKPPDEDLTDFFGTAQSTLEHSYDSSNLTSGWDTREQGAGEGAASLADRLAAAEGAAATFSAFTSEAATDLRGRMRRLRAHAGIEDASPEQRAELGVALEEAEALIASLQREAEAIRGVAAQLLEGGLDDLFGFFGASEPAAPAPKPPTSSALPGAVQGWLERQVAHEGVDGLALFADADTLVAGELPTEAEALHRAVDEAKTRADTLATGLEGGDATTLSVRTREHTLVAFWLSRARSLVLVTRAQGDAARLRLEAALPELVTLLE